MIANPQKILDLVATEVADADRTQASQQLIEKG
jgi:hypothetical protein